MTVDREQNNVTVHQEQSSVTTDFVLAMEIKSSVRRVQNFKKFAHVLYIVVRTCLVKNHTK